jgi:tellurite resistance protein
MTEPPASLRNLDRDTLEALIEMMFLAANADEEFSDEERTEFAANVAELSLRRIVGDDFKTLMTRIETGLEKEGRTARLATLKPRIVDEQMRKDALAIAIRMVAVDGVVRTSERDLVLEVADALEIDGNVAADLMRELTRHVK